MADIVFNRAAKLLLDADVDFNAPDDIRVMLLQVSGGIDKDYNTIALMLANSSVTELTTEGDYDRAALANEATSEDDTNDRAIFDADDVTFSNLSQSSSETIVGYVVFLEGGADSSSFPILYGDISPAITPNGDFTIEWSTGGILQAASA